MHHYKWTINSSECAKKLLRAFFALIVSIIIKIAQSKVVGYKIVQVENTNMHSSVVYMNQSALNKRKNISLSDSYYISKFHDFDIKVSRVMNKVCSAHSLASFRCWLFAKISTDIYLLYKTHKTIEEYSYPVLLQHLLLPIKMWMVHDIKCKCI